MRLTSAVSTTATLCLVLFFAIMLRVSENINRRIRGKSTNLMSTKTNQRYRKLVPPAPYYNTPTTSSPIPQSASTKEVEYWVHRYMRWHEVNRHNATRVAMFMPVPYGFGDNVKGMINMYGYAVLTKRLFLMDIGTSPISRSLSEESKRRFVYDRESNEYGGPGMWAGTSIRTGWGVGFPWKARKLLNGNNRVVALRVGIIPSPTEIQRSFGIGHKIPNYSLIARRTITKLLLEPSTELNKTRSYVSMQLGLCDSGVNCNTSLQQHYIALHARLGGVGEEEEKRFRKLQNKYAKVASCLAGWVVQIARRHNMKNARVFLATDTQKFRVLFNRTLGGNRVRWLDLHGTRLIHSHNTNSSESHTLMQLDNLLIGNARHIVAFKSGFSDVAFWRGEARTFQTLWHHHCRINRR